MNIVEYTHKFQQTEINYDFFNYTDNEGIKYWDIVRYDIFFAVFNYQSINILPTEEALFDKKRFQFKNLIKYISDFTNYYLKTSFKKYKYLVFSCSRIRMKMDLTLI